MGSSQRVRDVRSPGPNRTGGRGAYRGAANKGGKEELGEKEKELCAIVESVHKALRSSKEAVVEFNDLKLKATLYPHHVIQMVRWEVQNGEGKWDYLDRFSHSVPASGVTEILLVQLASFLRP